MKLDTMPASALHDFPNCIGAYSEYGSKFLKRRSSKGHIANLSNLFSGELGAAMPSPVSAIHAAFFAAIKSIIPFGAEKHMGWAKTRRVVAAMEGAKSVWDSAYCHLIGYSVNKIHFRVNAYAAIPFPPLASWPFQAGIICWELLKHLLKEFEIANVHRGAFLILTRKGLI